MWDAVVCNAALWHATTALADITQASTAEACPIASTEVLLAGWWWLQ